MLYCISFFTVLCNKINVASMSTKNIKYCTNLKVLNSSVPRENYADYRNVHSLFLIP